MNLALQIYALAAIIVFGGGIATWVWFLDSDTDEARRISTIAARTMLLSPIWPLLLLWVLGKYFGRVWADATRRI